MKVLTISELDILYRSGTVSINRRLYNVHLRLVETPEGINSPRNFYGLAVL